MALLEQQISEPEPGVRLVRVGLQKLPIDRLRLFGLAVALGERRQRDRAGVTDIRDRLPVEIAAGQRPVEIARRAGKIACRETRIAALRVDPAARVPAGDHAIDVGARLALAAGPRQGVDAELDRGLGVRIALQDVVGQARCGVEIALLECRLRASVIALPVRRPGLGQRGLDAAPLLVRQSVARERGVEILDRAVRVAQFAPQIAALGAQHAACRVVRDERIRLACRVARASDADQRLDANPYRGLGPRRAFQCGAARLERPIVVAPRQRAGGRIERGLRLGGARLGERGIEVAALLGRQATVAQRRGKIFRRPMGSFNSRRR